MISKQRVIAELEHREPDRVPTGEFATDYPIIEQLLGGETFWRGKAKMIKALWEGRRHEVVESQKRDIAEFTLKLEIQQQVRFSLKHCAPGGGFILGSSHSLMTGCTKENYLMMLKTLQDFGQYPIRIPEEMPEPNWGPA